MKAQPRQAGPGSHWPGADALAAGARAVPLSAKGQPCLSSEVSAAVPICFAIVP